MEANDRLRAVSAVHPTQSPEELTTVERRHAAVDENRVRHGDRADRNRLTYIRGFSNLETHALENTADNFSDYRRIVHHQNMPHPQSLFTRMMIDGLRQLIADASNGVNIRVVDLRGQRSPAGWRTGWTAVQLGAAVSVTTSCAVDTLSVA